MNAPERPFQVPTRKILVGHNRYLQAGGEARVFDAEVSLLTRYGHEVSSFVADNQRIAEMSRLALVTDTVWNRQSYKAIRETVERESIEVAHFHNTFPLLSPSALAAASDGGAAVVQTLHNYRLFCPSAQFFRDGQVCEDCSGLRLPVPAIRHSCYRGSRSASAVAASTIALHRLLQTWTKYVDLFVVPSCFARSLFVRLGLPETRIRVKPHFVDPDPGPGNGSGGFVLFLGRLAPEKGLTTLLAAADRLSGKIEVRIAGDGPLSSKVAVAAETIPRVSWLGRLPNEEALRLIGEASCVVVPSETYETFGLVVVEAFARGTPVVVTRHGALRELVIEGETGWTFDSGSDVELADALTCVRQLDQETMARIRLNARREFVNNYTAAKNYRLLIDVYEQAVVTRKSRGYQHRTD